MEQIETFEKLLKFAVIKEEEAAAFYEFLAAESKAQNIRQVFLDFARQEKEHQKVFARLVKEGCNLGRKGSAHTDLHLSDYLVETPFDPNMSYQDAVILAMKREEKSEAFYRELSHRVDDGCLAETILKLASEEAAHKAALESIYERDVLTEG